MEKKENQPDGVQALGVSESVQNVWQFAVLRPSQRLLAKVDRYVAAHPELTDVQRGKISDTRKELESQLQGVDEALDAFATLVDAIEYHEAPRPGVNYSHVKGIPYYQALCSMEQARERVLQAGTVHHKLAYKLTALCRDFEMPHQATKAI